MVRCNSRAGVLLIVAWLGLALIALGLSASARAEPDQSLDLTRNLPDHAIQSSVAITYYAYLPVILKPLDVCRLTGENYGRIPVSPETFTPETHPDVNLAVRGYTAADYFLGLIDLDGPADSGAPQLAGVFSETHPPTIMAVYQVGVWDWGCNCVIGPIAPPEDPAVTLINLAATPGDLVRVPDRNAIDIGLGYKAMVLYAARDRITLKYTGEDNMISGYGLHLENICVDANLLALYNELHSQGRDELPALNAGQAIGRVPGANFGVAIRDNAVFQDPRSRKDWWWGY